MGATRSGSAGVKVEVFGCKVEPAESKLPWAGLNQPEGCVLSDHVVTIPSHFGRQSVSCQVCVSASGMVTASGITDAYVEQWTIDLNSDKHVSMRAHLESDEDLIARAQALLEDTNMANVGTEEDRHRRKEVADTEPEWKKAGPPLKPGFVIWKALYSLISDDFTLTLVWRVSRCSSCP